MGSEYMDEAFFFNGDSFGDSFISNARALEPGFKARMFAPVEASE